MAQAITKRITNMRKAVLGRGVRKKRRKK